MKLDRTRSYGTVYGGAGHTFEQDGKYFDHEGELVQVEEPKPEEPKGDDAKKPAKASKAKPEEPKGDDQLSAQMSN
jgi:hypothetical protein